MLKEQFLEYRNKIGALARSTNEEIEQYEIHFALLKNWNERMALVSKKSIDKSFGSHYVDSILISDFAEERRAGRPVFDLGTGAGFPGIIYAIRNRAAKVSVSERSLKKQTFLSVVQATLNLDNLILGGEFPSERRMGLFLARAVLPPVELFKFMSKRMVAGSTLIVNVGGSSEPIKVPADFVRSGELVYELPMDCGPRRVESFEFVPRGTK
jgi:16S rRNA (guanine527-N7)-methyltransferase